MDPLLAFRALIADVEHMDGYLAHVESCLKDARAFLLYAQHIVDVGQVLRIGDPHDLREEAAKRWVSMKSKSAIARQRC